MVPKAKSDVYVTLLGVSLGAILLGCILLALVLKQYNFETKAAQLSAPPALTAWA